MLIEKRFSFDAAHILPRHTGKCGRLHGHTYSITVGLEGPVENHSQFVLDYGDLKTIVKPIVDLWDHRVLNSFIIYPSAENIATHLAFHLRPKLQFGWLDRYVVKVSETPDTIALWDSSRKQDFIRIQETGQSEWKSPEVKLPIIPIDKMQGVLEDKQAEAMAAYWKYQQLQTEADQLLMYNMSLERFNEDELPLFTGKPQ